MAVRLALRAADAGTWRTCHVEPFPGGAADGFRHFIASAGMTTARSAWTDDWRAEISPSSPSTCR